MRVIFMGTPDFAVPSLQAIVAAGHEVVAVYSQPPRPAGRGMKLAPSPVHRVADGLGISVQTPVRLKDADAQAVFASYGADIAVVVAYGLLLPQAVLDAPRYGCLNLHPSDLPRWRGAAPLHRTLLAGDRVTACCVMQMDAGLDTGPVLAREMVALAEGTTTGMLHDQMAQRGARMLCEVLDAYAAGNAPVPVPQAQEGITYAPKILKEESIIDWTRPALEILAHIHGLSPYPAAHFQLRGEVVKCFAAERAVPPPQDFGMQAGTLLDDALSVMAGDGQAVRLLELQRAGKSRQAAPVFLQGFPVKAGECCG